MIYVHTSGRWQAPLPTWEALSGTGVEATLVVQKTEARFYRAAYPQASVMVLPSYIKTLSPTRQYILDHADGPFILMDDDLSFFVRRKDDPTKFLPASPAALRKAVERTYAYLRKYAHVCWCPREGGNRVLKDRECARAMRVLGYHPQRVHDAEARFDRLPTKQDFDMTLQLLRAGLPNLLMHDIIHDQGASQAAGGCSAYRTPEIMTVSAHALAKLHPGFVQVVEKETKTAWGGGTRTDVRIGWKKAYESGRE